MVDRRNPPADPAVARRREAIHAYLAEALASEIEHHIEQIVDADDALA
jgi:hypothetical protein